MTLTEIMDQLGLKLSVVVAGTLGAIATLGMMPEGSSRTHKVIIVIGGAACASYFGPAVTDYFGFSESVAAGVNFIIGGVGMNIFGGLVKLSQRFRDKPTLDIDRLKRLGDDGDR